MAKREQPEVRFRPVRNSNLVCKDCLYENSGNDLHTLTCDAYVSKPGKVLMGKECPKYVDKSSV